MIKINLPTMTVTTHYSKIRASSSGFPISTLDGASTQKYFSWKKFLDTIRFQCKRFNSQPHTRLIKFSKL